MQRLADALGGDAQRDALRIAGALGAKLTIVVLDNRGFG